MSAVLRSKRKTRVESVQFLGALAAMDGIQKTTGFALRWPNDILVEGRKVGEVITEASFLDSELPYISLGIGISCNFEGSLLECVSTESVTLMETTGARVDTVALCSATLEALARFYATWSEGKDRNLNARIRRLLSTLGRRVTIRTPSGRIIGFAESSAATGLSPSGQAVEGS